MNLNANFRVSACLAALGISALAVPAMAQPNEDDAVESADDAFGMNVGLESSGIYTERNARGFSPLEAGNSRIDGNYFDQVASLSGRLRQQTAIRVGFRAVDMPFVAPTGVVDNRFIPFPDKAANSLTWNQYYYGGYIAEWDMRLPIVADRVALTGGFADALTSQGDGTDQRSWGVTVRPIIRAGEFEFAPFAAMGEFARNEARPLAVVQDGYLPPIPGRRQYLGQDWAKGRKLHQNIGATFKGKIGERVFLRGGAFYSMSDRTRNFSEIYRVRDASGLADHFVFADPAHDIHSYSGEMLAGVRLTDGSLRQYLFAGYRSRNRYTETGGADFLDFGEATYGVPDLHPKPEFDFGVANSGRIKQSSVMVGYLGRIANIARINLGIQKARYRGISVQGATGVRDTSRAGPWLYNAALMVRIMPNLAAYVATQRGLEDSGLAPENAANRDEQLPATRTTQYEGGLQWDYGKGQLVVAAFEITKPYFTFNEAREFVQLGKRRHRGIEASLTAHVGNRFDLLAGAYVMDPEVTGPARDAGLVGRRPAGVPKIFGQIDANYRTAIFGGLTVTGALHYTGKRAVTSRPIDHLGGKQLTLPGWISVDVGFRHSLKLGGTDVTVRAVVKNLLDEKEWYVAASDVIFPEERRRWLGTVAVDF